MLNQYKVQKSKDFGKYKNNRMLLWNDLFSILLEEVNFYNLYTTIHILDQLVCFYLHLLFLHFWFKFYFFVIFYRFAIEFAIFLVTYMNLIFLVYYWHLKVFSNLGQIGLLRIFKEILTYFSFFFWEYLPYNE